MARSFRELADPIDRDPARRARVDQHKKAIRDAMAIGDVRRMRGASQAELARSLEVSRARISALEQQDDVYLSTLRQYVQALGGRLEVAAVFDEDGAEDRVLIGPG